ncbi:MAG: potassium channel protein [Nitrospirae bacterium]|nr:MAG: potassium channel protein [Nitrospirota bacterium]
MQIIWYFKQFLKVIRDKKVTRLLFLTSIIILIGTVSIVHFEKGLNHNINNVFDGLWWSFVTITTVGYGDIFPITVKGRIIAMFLMLTGIGLLGMFTATIATIFVEEKIKREMGLQRLTEIKDHTIICGWNYKASEIIKEIRANSTTKDTPIILIADSIDAKPVDDEYLEFIKGSVDEDTLNRANLKKAKNIIILADERLEPHLRDAQTILTALTVETLNPDVYTCVDIVNPANVSHCRRAKADEIIVSGEFSTKLLVRSAIYHGISKFIDELLSSRYGTELLKITTPNHMVGKSFMELFTEMKKIHNAIVVAVQSADGKVFISNPPSDYKVGEGDNLILIADNTFQQPI